MNYFVLCLYILLKKFSAEIGDTVDGGFSIEIPGSKDLILEPDAHDAEVVLMLEKYLLSQKLIKSPYSKATANAFSLLKEVDLNVEDYEPPLVGGNGHESNARRLLDLGIAAEKAGIKLAELSLSRKDTEILRRRSRADLVKAELDVIVDVGTNDPAPGVSDNGYVFEPWQPIESKPLSATSKVNVPSELLEEFISSLSRSAQAQGFDIVEVNDNRPNSNPEPTGIRPAPPPNPPAMRNFVDDKEVVYFPLPDIKGMTLEEAERAIEEAGFPPNVWRNVPRDSIYEKVKKLFRKTGRFFNVGN